MKYYRNYDGGKKSPKTEEGGPEADEVQPVNKKRKAFKHQKQLKAVAIQSLPPGEDKASHARHLRFLQGEEKKVHPNKQVICLKLFSAWTVHKSSNTRISQSK